MDTKRQQGNAYLRSPCLRICDPKWAMRLTDAPQGLLQPSRAASCPAASNRATTARARNTGHATKTPSQNMTVVRRAPSKRPHDGRATLESDPRACGGCVAPTGTRAHSPQSRSDLSLPPQAE
jgi:hypothetical protein